MVSLSDTIVKVLHPFLDKENLANLSKSIEESTIDELVAQYFPHTQLTEAKVVAIEALSAKLSGQFESSSSSDQALIHKINKLSQHLRISLTSQVKQTSTSPIAVPTEDTRLQAVIFAPSNYQSLPFDVLGEIIQRLPLKELATVNQLNRENREAVVEFLEQAACQIVKEFENNESPDPFLTPLKAFIKGLSLKKEKSIQKRSEEAYAIFEKFLSFVKAIPDITVKELPDYVSQAIQLSAACNMTFDGYLEQLANLKAQAVSLENVPEPLKHDFLTVILAVKRNGLALQHASPDLQNNLSVVTAAVTQKGSALWWASLALLNNLTVVTAAVTQNGDALQYASRDMKNNLIVVTAAVTQNGSALQYASKTLQQNPTLRTLAGWPALASM